MIFQNHYFPRNIINNNFIKDFNRCIAIIIKTIILINRRINIRLDNQILFCRFHGNFFKLSKKIHQIFQINFRINRILVMKTITSGLQTNQTPISSIETDFYVNRILPIRRVKKKRYRFPRR